MHRVRRRQWSRWVLVACFAIAGAGLVLASCNDGADDEARALSSRSVAGDVRPLSNVIYSKADVERTPSGSPLNAFLQYRQALQLQAWPRATDFFDPGLAGHIGLARLVVALQAAGDEVRSARPRIIDVRRSANGAVVSYALRREGEQELLRSVQWRREDGSWRIVYDSMLDDALALAAQRAAQTRDDPLARQPGRTALRAAAAARKLQADYLQDLRSRDDAPVLDPGLTELATP